MSNDLSVLNAFKVDVNVGLDEVVNVFLSRYEEKLHEQKAEKQALIKSLKKQVTGMETALCQQSNDRVSHCVGENEQLGVSVSVHDTDVNWTGSSYGGEKSPHVVTVLHAKWLCNDTHMSKKAITLIGPSVLEQYNSINTDIDDTKGELTMLLGAISDVGRKERTIRGVISARKLEEAGYADLLNDESLLKLIQL